MENAFDRASRDYRKQALVQRQAAFRLMELLHIGSRDAVLDLGCGPGHLTYALTKTTRSRVVGVDVSEGMIAKARELYPDLEFRVLGSEQLDYRGLFHVVFCNSTMQWFADPDRSLDAIREALKPEGRLGVACPATFHGFPWMEPMVAEAAADPELAPVFKTWRNPWFFLEDELAYEAFFEKHGFTAQHLEIVLEQNEYSADEAFGIYLSGAANGYLGSAYYPEPPSEAYVRRFNQVVRDAIVRKAENGRITVDFQRLYYVGKKA